MIWNMTFLSTIGCLFWRQKTAMCLPLSLYHFLCKFSPIFIVCGNKRGCHLAFLFITPMSSTETLFQGWASWSRIRYKHTLSSSNIWRFCRLLNEVMVVEQCLSGKLWVAWVFSYELSLHPRGSLELRKNLEPFEEKEHLASMPSFISDFLGEQMSY